MAEKVADNSKNTETSAALKTEAAKRADNRTQRPESPVFRKFIGEDWGERPAGPARAAVADYLPARHLKLGRLFPGEYLVFPAGELKVRSNDTDYRFRAHCAFAHLSGLAGEREPGAVLVLRPLSEPGAEVSETEPTHQAVLYFHPRTSRSSEEFYADSRYGEFWVGARMSSAEMSVLTGLRVKNIDSLYEDLCAGEDGAGRGIRVIREADPQVTERISEIRSKNGLCGDPARDYALAEAASELRLKKDEFEISELQKAIDATGGGFTEILRSLPRAVGHWRGERVVEGAFGAKAREEGNGLGYETIAACGNHANTLHWIGNNGPVTPGDLMLVDAGIEMDSLYTADITRTFPVSGKFSPAQREVYEAVLEAADYAFETASRPGVRFRDVHAAAMEVITKYLEKWGMLPCSAAESLLPENQQHRRWMPHGTSHHLGMDVHDCAQARSEMYRDALLEPGMVFTIEPGLYFRADDLKVPPRLRGIGVRIEDDILVTENGAQRLSENIPRTADAVEKWISQTLLH